MQNLQVVNQNVKSPVSLDSREVAGMVGKEHKNLLADIRKYEEFLTGSNLSSLDFFTESVYRDVKGEKRPCYNITKKGCEFVAHKLTGQKGAIFTATYINKFHEMEQQVMPKLSKELQAIFSLDQRTVEIDTRITSLENNMPLFNVECKELQALVKKIATRVLGGYRSIAYKDNSLRGQVYSDLQKQLKREFGVERYEGIKRSQLSIAKNIVNSYKEPFVLAEEIQLANGQMKIEA